MKRCSTCREVKPLEEFHRKHDGAQGRQPNCKVCSAAWSKVHVAKDEVKTRKRAIAKQWRLDNPEKYWANMLRAKHSITVEQYTEILDSQGGVCAMCHNPPGVVRLAVDHDHSCCSGNKTCGQCIRGLLCADCNRGVGLFKDNPAALRRAADYLESYQC